MGKVKVVIVDKQNEVKIPTGTRLLMRKACNATLRVENFNDDAEVYITIVNDEQIKEMNSQFRNIDKSTDVLSFPLGQDGVYDTNPESGAKMLGDIVVSVEHAVTQADLYGHGIKREIAYLTVHSLLHLLGYDHVENNIERIKMRDREEEVMALLGLSIIKVG